jgi:hypothetical protein
MRKEQGFQMISKPWNNIVKNISKKANYGKFPTNLLNKLLASRLIAKIIPNSNSPTSKIYK